jgi:multidrug efflux system membrane fusion protein
MADLKPPRSHRSMQIVVALAVVAGIAFAARHFAAEPAPARRAQPPVPVVAAPAKLSDVPQTVAAVGTVQSIDTVSVQSRVTGTIESIDFTPGQNVKAGQLLFQIDSRPYQAALDQAKAQLAHDQGVLDEGQMDLKRYQALEKQRAIAAQTAQDQVYVVEQDKAQVALDQANVETAQLNLSYTRIAAAISGRTGPVQVDAGNLVQAGGSSSAATGATAKTAAATTSGQGAATPLVTLTQMKPIYVDFSVPQTMLAQILRNQAKAPLEVAAYSQSGKLLENGKLAVISNQVDTTTGTIALQATFPNTDETLWPGEFVTARLIVAIRRNVVTVPSTAIMTGPTGPYVYVIESNDTARRVNVQLTARGNNIAVIAKGIKDGEKVVINGQTRLANGVKVAVEGS